MPAIARRGRRVRPRPAHRFRAAVGERGSGDHPSGYSHRYRRRDASHPPWAAITSPPYPNLSALQLARLGDSAALQELRTLTNLTIIGLRDVTGLEDLTPLDFLEAPRWFGVHNCPDLPDPSLLVRWSPTLQRLWLRDCPQLDLKRLPNLPRLNFLDLSGSAAVTDLTAISQFHELRTLRLGYHSRLPDLAPLRALPHLRRLWLFDSGDVDLPALAGKPNLTIYAYRNQTLHGADQLGHASTVERR